MPFVSVCGIRMYYEIHGGGPRLLFISGTGGDLRRSPNAFDFPLTSHFEVLSYLYRLRDELGDGLCVDPFVGRSPRQLAGALGAAHYGPYTPDAIAVLLVQQSIEFLENGAIDVLRAREIYATAMTEAPRRFAARR